MKFNKKIGLGLLRTTMAFATPLALTISCGNEEQKLIELNYDAFENQGMATNFDILSKQNDEHIDLLMENGRFKDADLIVDKDLENLGSLIMDITLSWELKMKLDKVLEDAKKKHSGNNNYNLSLYIGTNKEIEPDFFEMFTDSTNKVKISKKINDLSKANKFHLEFNLILPKWLNEFHEITPYFNWSKDSNQTHNRREDVVEKVVSIEKEKGSNFKVKDLFLWRLDLNWIKFGNLPRELEHLYISSNNLTNLDGIEKLTNLKSLYFKNNNISTINLDNLPKSLKKIEFDEWDMSDEDLKKIKQYCKDHNIKISK